MNAQDIDTDPFGASPRHPMEKNIFIGPTLNESDYHQAYILACTIAGRPEVLFTEIIGDQMYVRFTDQKAMNDPAMAYLVKCLVLYVLGAERKFEVGKPFANAKINAYNRNFISASRKMHERGELIFVQAGKIVDFTAPCGNMFYRKVNHDKIIEQLGRHVY